MDVKDDRAPIFAGVERKYGFVPNLIREMARHSPAVARVYLGGQEAMARATLTPAERQAVQLAVSSKNGCEYCQAAHRTAGRMTGVSKEELEAIEQGRAPATPRLRSLVVATRLVMDKRGFLEEADLKALEADGVSRTELYEVVALIGLKTISNYVNHIAHTPLDAAFAR